MPLTVYLVAFLGMGALGFWKGMPAGTPAAWFARSPAAAADATATVRICQATTRSEGPAAASADGGSEQRPAPAYLDVEQVREQILARAAETQRERLSVETAADPAPGSWKVSIALRDMPADEAARDVSALAESYADVYRGQWKAAADRDYEATRAATERAAEQLRAAQGQLSAVLDRQIQAVREASQRAQRPPAPAPSVENPDWTELNRQLYVLLARRSELLTSRTPQHPAVQDVESRIDALRQRLASLSQYVPGPAAATAAGKAEAAAAAVSAALADPSEVGPLQRTVEAAGRNHRDAVRLERLAWQARQNEPLVEVQPAPEPPPPARRWPMTAMALLGALATGLTMVLGLGMISAGCGIEPPLGTARALEAAAGAPVVGILPEDSGRPDGASRAARLRLLRWTVMLCGALGLAGSLVMLWYVHPV
jgi:uncharacterized protein YukE